MGVMQRYTLTEQKFVVNYIDLTSEEVYINRVENYMNYLKKIVLIYVTIKIKNLNYDFF